MPAQVPSRGEADTLGLAFQSVQLMFSDYLPSLSGDMQTACIEARPCSPRVAAPMGCEHPGGTVPARNADLAERRRQVAALYALQTTDVNISLTAIGMLWNTADLFAQSLDPPAVRHARHYVLTPVVLPIIAHTPLVRLALPRMASGRAAR